MSRTVRGWLGMLMVVSMLLCVTGCPAGQQNSVTGVPKEVSRRAVAAPSSMTVAMPRTYMPVAQALEASYEQCGLMYAVVPADFGGVVGPYTLGRPVAALSLIEHVAKASNTTVRVVRGVAVFEGRAPAGLTDARADALLARLAGQPGAQGRAGSADLNGSSAQSTGPGSSQRLQAQPVDVQQVHEIGRLAQVRVIVPLSRLTAHEDERVRLAALRALVELEGDFMRQEWPGRLSIFELLQGELDTQSLLWAVEEGGPGGGLVWNMAANVLARARCPLLTRNTWTHAYQKTPGAMQMCTWAVGRVDDPSGAWAIRGRPAKPFTNDPEDAYLAAMSLGRRAAWRLLDHARGENLEARRAAVFGAGFAPADSTAAATIIARGMSDSDTVVRFLACQSAARLGGAERVGRLAQLAGDANRPVHDRVAALTALPEAREGAACAAVLAAAGDKDATIRATAARMLGRIGGVAARDALLKLGDDPDRWVRAEAARSLGILGDAESLAAVDRFLARADSTHDMRIAAVVGLGQGRSPVSAGMLSRIALNTGEPARLRRYAIRALAQLADRAGAQTLRRMAPVSSPVHDREAVRYLDLATPAETARMLIPILTGGERDDAGSAANRLAELGHGPGVRELCEGFDVFDNSARMMHMWGAIRAAGPEANQALIDAAASPRSNIREVAALALGGRAEPRAVAVLIRLCADEHNNVRHLAAQSLGVTGDPAAVPVLIGLARQDPSPRVVSEAIRALRRRDWAGRRDVKACFADLVGTERDAGVPNPKAPSVTDQPAHSFVLRNWPADYNDLSITNVTYESSLTYDSDRGRVVQWGSHGRRADSPQQGETWFYGASSNEWARLTGSRHWPNEQCLTWGTTYDPANQVVVSPTSGHGGHGWINFLRANLAHSVPWVLDARTEQWRAARPVVGTGYALGQVCGDFDTEHDVTIFHHGPLWAYDALENRWDKLGADVKRPDYGEASAWDPLGKRLIALAPGGRGGMATWAFDPEARTWTDLKAESGPPDLASRLIYDSANDVMLGFAHVANRALRVWVYHLRENRWEVLPMVYPTPRFGSLDCTYDSRNNVVVFSGGWESGFSGELTQRETWTYRYRPADPARRKLPGRIADARLATDEGGKVVLSWTPVKGAGGYRVLRGLGQRPWNARLEPLAGKLPADANSFTEKVAAPGAGQAYFYRIEALDGMGEVVARSRLLRTRPVAVASAWAGLTAKGVKVGWSPSPGEDVVGYRVYRAQVALGSPWSKAFDSAGLADRLKLVSGQKLVETTDFLDTLPREATGQAGGAADQAAGPNTGKPGDTRTVSGREVEAGLAEAPSDARPAEPGELHWPATFVYVIRPVNRWGVEGGDSPATLALPDAPGPVRVIPWADGRRLVIWSPPPGEAAQGYHVMRMDDWIGTSVYRFNGAPLACVGYWDDEEFPTADRRRYYIVGVDQAGALGVPSSGAWGHGFP